MFQGILKKELSARLLQGSIGLKSGFTGLHAYSARCADRNLCIDIDMINDQSRFKNPLLGTIEPNSAFLLLDKVTGLLTWVFTRSVRFINVPSYRDDSVINSERTSITHQKNTTLV